MRRILIVLTCAAALATAAVAAASGHSAKLQLRGTKLGKILVNRSGFTLYMFTRDARNKDNCVKIFECTALWPPVTSSAKVQIGPGVKRSLIGTIKVPGVGRQVTYAGHPLYTYVADTGPGQTFYVGLFQNGGNWYALNASGKVVK
ncbi:MAG: hypothetical protein JO120_04605 [Solirubrobacterales bacterium]|nr:hypothetical protein [Solirubrobacterales bacterium]